jgi:transposase
VTTYATMINGADRMAHAPVVSVAPVDRKRRVCLKSGARARLTEELLALPERSKEAYGQLAERYSVSVRTVENVLRAARTGSTTQGPTRREPCPLPADALDIVRERQSLKQAWRVLQAEQRYDREYVQFTRQMRTLLGQDVLAKARCSARRADSTLYLRVARPEFMARYTIDLFSLRMEVVNGKKLTHPTAMLIREDYTGTVVLHYVFESDQLTAAMIANVLAQAMVGYTVDIDDEAIRLGGIPIDVFADNGSVFAAAELREALAGMGVGVTHSNSYSSNENGAHERQHNTVRVQLLKSLPRSNDGRRDATGELVDHRNVMTLAEVRDLVARWVWWHNAEPTGEENTSPLQRWNTAAHDKPVQFAAPAEVAHMALPHKATCKRYPEGVLLHKRHYVSEEVSKVGSTRFVVGVWLGDDDHVEVFHTSGTYVGRATDTRKCTAAESQAILTRRAVVKEIIVEADKRANARNPMDRPDLPPLPVIHVGDRPTTSPPPALVTLEAMVDYLDPLPPQSPSDEEGPR